MKKEMNLPEIKKTISAFLVGEEGKISKQSIIKAGVVLTAISLGALRNVSSEEATICDGGSIRHGTTKQWECLNKEITCTHTSSCEDSHSSDTPHTNSVSPLAGADGTVTDQHGHHASHGSSHTSNPVYTVQTKLGGDDATHASANAKVSSGHCSHGSGGWC
jgi:hypothetical protein